MTFFDFIQWCFRSRESAAATIIVLSIALWGLRDIALALRGRSAE